LAVCRRRFGAQVTALQALPVFEHAFTHFRLSITPQPLRVTSLDPHAAEPGHVWLPLAKAGAAAIPTPVRRLLLVCDFNDTTL
jgi:A/G-specific adenine glycosylase